MIVHLKSRVTSSKQTLIRQSRLYSGMTCHSPVFLTTKGSHSHTALIGNKLLQISIPGSDSFPRLPNTHPYAMTEPAVPFLYPTFETCKHYCPLKMDKVKKLNKFGSLESYRSLTFLKFDLSNKSLRCVLSVREIPSIWRIS